MENQARRLFIALPVRNESAQYLSEVRTHLHVNERFLKIVPAENYHLTLKFLGQVESELSEAVTESFRSLDQLNSISYELKGLGAFPSADNPSVVWAGLKCDKKSLDAVIQSVENLAVSKGFPPDKRRFVPHLTLARLKKNKTADREFKNYILREKHTLFGVSEFTELVLYESVLKPEGPEYRRVEVISLVKNL